MRANTSSADCKAEGPKKNRDDSFSAVKEIKKDISSSKIILVRDDPKLALISFAAILQVPDDVANVISAEQFIKQNMEIKDLADNARQITFCNHFLNPTTKKLEPNQLIGSLKKDSVEHAQILTMKGEFVVSKTSELVGYRIGLHAGLAQSFVIEKGEGEQIKSSQSGWAIELDVEGQGTYTTMIPTTHSLIWLTANQSGFTISLPDEKDPMKVGRKVLAGQDFIVYRYQIIGASTGSQAEKNKTKVTGF